MKILFLGDIVGRPGRNICKIKVPELIEKFDVDFVIANGENASHGKGLTEKNYDELCDCGIDFITLGNHYDNKYELRRYIDQVDNLIRPLNLIKTYPGEGSKIVEINGIKIRISNILGTAFINEEVSSPYLAIEDVIKNEEQSDIHIIDFHGESTSEKQCFAYALDGQVSAVLGTHTHVQTNDARVLNGGTAFMCDVGMCGTYDSVIGFEKNSVVDKVIFGAKSRFEISDKGSLMINGCLLDIDESNGKCRNIISIKEVVENEKQS